MSKIFMPDHEMANKSSVPFWYTNERRINAPNNLSKEILKPKSKSSHQRNFFMRTHDNVTKNTKQQGLIKFMLEDFKQLKLK